MTPDHFSTRIVVLDEFLVAQELRNLLDYTFSRAGDFNSTQVIGHHGESYNDPHTRRSRVLFDIGPFTQLFTERLLRFLPHVLSRLARHEFSIRWVEVQLTGTNNGEFFRAHTDNESSEVRSREITFVYFFHREPRAFEGGELRIYDRSARHGNEDTAPSRVIYPLQNQVVFFESGCLHEIMPVGCATGDFYDSRFTVNGWVHT